MVLKLFNVVLTAWLLAGHQPLIVSLASLFNNSVPCWDSEWS